MAQGAPEIGPGPALANLFLGGWPVLLFIASMLAGMMAFSLLNRAA